MRDYRVNTHTVTSPTLMGQGGLKWTQMHQVKDYLLAKRMDWICLMVDFDSVDILALGRFIE